ncbi:hypothetical protein SCALM49S_00866 [Streptomyces californicus]
MYRSRSSCESPSHHALRPAGVAVSGMRSLRCARSASRTSASTRAPDPGIAMPAPAPPTALFQSQAAPM